MLKKNLWEWNDQLSFLILEKNTFPQRKSTFSNLFKVIANEEESFWGFFSWSSSIFKKKANNKQLLDEVERDIMNYQSRGLCYLPKRKAEADNTDTRVW